MRLSVSVEGVGRGTARAGGLKGGEGTCGWEKIEGKLLSHIHSIETSNKGRMIGAVWGFLGRWQV